MRVPKIVAEIGCNHKGDFSIARDMIATAATFCRADVIKFQKRNVKELLTPAEYNAPHPNPQHSYGATYGEHRELLEFTVDQHRELMNECARYDVSYSTSVWDVSSAREMIALGPRMLKVPSASNLNWNLLRLLAEQFRGEIHISLGMTTREEEERIVELFGSQGRAGDLVIYACTSGYPVAFNELCLLEIVRLKETYETRTKAIGFSGHHLGIAADVAAFALGSEWIERHFTMDRTWKGTDHAASLEPDGLRRLCRDLRSVAKAMTFKPAEMMPVEMAQRLKLKYIR